jgi:type II secretory ATPase GspE/PulE/Tfp pilus assembly ATPase PilB-like protein
MGIQPFLTSSAVIGVVAQRLVRVICPECKELYTPSDEERKFLKLPDDVTELARGKGCDYCLNTGYYGRTGIFEVFEMDEDVRKLVLAQVPSSDIKNLTLSKGMKSLSESGREKVIQKVSTVDDLRRVIYTGKD